MVERKFDLEERLIQFGVQVLKIAEKMPQGYASRHIANQMTRSGTSPALTYGEAHAAESPADFIHKMKLGLKELRETFVSLRFVRYMDWLREAELADVCDENNQLISIFVTSIKTATRNNIKNSKKKKDEVAENEPA